jgi:hypothetical protein
LSNVITSALIIAFAIGFGLTSSCAHQSPEQAESQIASREAPIALQRTKGNNGRRCEARYYFGIHDPKIMAPEEGYSLYCHKLQLRLDKAIEEGNLKEIREALRYGANPELPVDDNHPLLNAAQNGHPNVVRLLIDNGADVNGGTFIIGTPLIAAANNGHTEVVKVLLERGADVCFKADGGTAEEVAQRQGYKQIVELLETAKMKRC